MNRLIATFDRLRARGEKALIPYVMAGDPSLDETKSFVLELERARADIVELGVPFSDPIADGPVIQKAAERALKSGTSLRRILEMVRSLRQETAIPLVLMTYYNSIYTLGEESFCETAAAAGVDGVIVPDMPPEEADSLCEAASRSGLTPIFLLAPTSTPDRMKEVVRRTRGFVYYVSLTGITGARLSGLETVKHNVGRIRKKGAVPVAVGFGISTPIDVKEVASFADGVIVGSAIVRIIGEHEGDPHLVKRVGDFVRSLKAATLS